MNSNWKECTIQSLIDERQLYIGDGYRAKNDELSNTGIPFARAGNINNGFHFEDADYFPIQDLHKVGNKISKANDSVFTSKGTVGRFAFVRQETPQFVYSPQLCFWRGLNESYINSRFLYFWMHSWEFWEQIHGVKDQTDMAEYVSLSDQRNMKITLPPLPEQQAIAGVLSSLDDKIDLLHRQNKTLEGMAEALWRQMFVEDADPRWKKGKLGDITEINPLRSIKKGAITTYLDMSNMPTNGSFPKEWVQREFSSGMKFKNGDTVMARITPCLENGKTAYVNFLNHEEIAWGSTEYILLAPKPGYCSEWYYFLARNDDFRDFAIQNMTGTSGRQRVSGDSIAQYEIAIPPKNIFDSFRTFAKLVMEHIKHNSFQIRTLSRLRDTLLPKLMSGEVRVNL